MAINFEQARYVDPNVDIKGTKIPLATMDKGIEKLDVLYNAARANDTKMAALNKRLLMNAHPGDVEAANAVNEFYNKKLQERIAAGNYEAHVWQTEADANDMAGLYERISQDKELRNKYEADILANNTIDPVEREDLVKIYQKEQAPLAFNQDLQAFNSRNILPYSVAANQDVPKILDSMANGWLPDTDGKTTVKIGISDGTQTDDYGNSIPAGMKIVTTDKGVTRIAKEEEIETYLRGAVKSHQPIRDMMAQKLKLSLNRKPLAEGETVEMRAAALEKEYIEPGIQFAKEKHGFVDSQTDIKHQILNAQKTSSDNGGGNGLKDANNPQAGDYRTTVKTVPNNFSSSIEGISNKYLEPEKLQSAKEQVLYTLENLTSNPQYSKKIAELDKKHAARKTASSMFATHEEMSPNVYSIINKIHKGEPLTIYDESYLKMINENINGVTEHTGASGVKDVSATISSVGSQANEDFFKLKYENEVNANGTFDISKAMEKDNKNMFGDNLDLNDGVGLARDLEWIELNGKNLGSGEVAIETFPETTSKDGTKHRFARIDGIINARNPAGFEPTYIHNGQRVQGSFEALGQRVATVGGKKYAIINHQEDLVNPEDKAYAYSAYYRREDARPKIVIPTRNGESIVEVSNRDGKSYSFTVDGKKRSILAKANFQPFFLKTNERGQIVIGEEVYGKHTIPVTMEKIESNFKNLKFVKGENGEEDYYTGETNSGNPVYIKAGIDPKQFMFSKIIREEF